MINSLCIEPCVVERKNRLIFKIKSLLTLFHLIRPKYMFDLKKYLTKSNPIWKLCIILLAKNKIVILIHKCKTFTLIRWRSLPTLCSLEAAQPGSSVQQLIQLNYTYVASMSDGSTYRQDWHLVSSNSENNNFSFVYG